MSDCTFCRPRLADQTLETLQQNNFDLRRVVTFQHFLYFLFAPTLCFQLSYPRSPRIRPWFLLRRVLQLCFLLTAQIYILLQFLYPTLMQAPKVFNVYTFNPVEAANFVVSSAVQFGPSLHHLLAARFRLCVPRLDEHPGGDPPVRRPTVLQGLVELQKPGRVLADLEPPGPQFFPAACGPPTGKKGGLTRAFTST